MDRSEAFLKSWEEAVAARDAARADALLSPTCQLVSPVTYKPIADRAQIHAILGAVLEVLPDFHYVRREVFPSGALLVFRGHVEGTPLEVEGIDLFDLDGAGQVDRLTVLVRPLKAAIAFAERMGRSLTAR